eukprot:7136510-Karenia_brevis.AAC.1
MQPKPSKVLGVEDGTEQVDESNQGSGNQEQVGGVYDPEWWGWGDSIGAIINSNNPNLQCYRCGGFGHIGVNCPKGR